MALGDLTAELVGRLPGLDAYLAETFLKRSWREICDRRPWSFLRIDGAVMCPTMVQDGHVAITQFFNTATCDAVATAALQAKISPINPQLESCQIRFPGVGTSNQIYSIISVDRTNPASWVITVDRPIVDATNAAAAYQVYRCYVTSPYPDTLRIEVMVDSINQLPLNLDHNAAYFDVMDPARQSMEQAAYLGWRQTLYGKPNLMQYELWPHPSSGQTFFLRVRRTGAALYSDPNDEQPEVVTDSLIIEKALLSHGYRWGQENMSRFPLLKAANWGLLMRASEASYHEQWMYCRKQDENQAAQAIVHPGHGLRGMWRWPWRWPLVIDANWMQAHPIYWN